MTAEIDNAVNAWRTDHPGANAAIMRLPERDRRIALARLGYSTPNHLAMFGLESESCDTYVIGLPNGIKYGIAADSAQAAVDKFLEGSRFAPAQARQTPSGWLASCGDFELIVSRVEGSIRVVEPTVGERIL